LAIDMRVVVCGGGVIGACIAYYLSTRGAEAVVVERTAVACAASGKSGGFLALDWCDGSPLERLARRSFELHAHLAETAPGDWGYRRLTTYGGFAGPAFRARPSGANLPWLAEHASVGRRLGTPDTTAQVQPAAFTAAMMHAARAAGAELRLGCVTGVVRGPNGVDGVSVEGEVVQADAVVIAMGPWSMMAADWLPIPRVLGLKGHSVIFETSDEVPAEALFLDVDDGEGPVSPEIYPRPDGTTYVCGISSESPVPKDPADVAPDPGAVERLEAIAASLSPILRRARVAARQACYRPVTLDGLPLIGAAPGVPGAYIATGHSVWGMLNGPATGEAIAELILDGETRHVDLAPFDPARLPAVDARRAGQLS
jgi:glycine/D-amino acid oxidase-like deaminating enzyme